MIVSGFSNLIHPVFFFFFFFLMLWCSSATAQLPETPRAANWIPWTFIGIVEVSVSAVYWAHQSQCWFTAPAALNRLGKSRWGAETLAALWRVPRPIKFPSCVSGQMSRLHLGRGDCGGLAGVPRSHIPLLLQAQLSSWKQNLLILIID